MASLSFPKSRLHTWHFLNFAREFSPVFLSMEVDMSRVVEVRNRLKAEGRNISYVTFLMQCAGRALEKYPEANSAVKRGANPQMIRYEGIHAKFTLDKRINGTRIVCPGKVENVNQAGLDEIQERVSYFRDNTFEDIEEFKGLRLLHKLPARIGGFIFKRVLGNLNKRLDLQGSFAVTSLGHKAVTAFYPQISATICFGMGTVAKKPVAIDNQLEIRPMLHLSMAFDHAAIDGALAADYLDEVARQLTNYEPA